MMGRRTLYGACLCTLALLGCSRAEPGMYAIYNQSGTTVIAPTVADGAGGHGAFAQAIDDNSVMFFGAAGSIKRGTTITVQWIAGAGRATWYQASLPVTLDQAGGNKVEIYFRPDRFVCASLVDDAHQRNRSADVVSAWIREDRNTHSCVQPTELPALHDGMAEGFDAGSAAHSWALYDRAGTTTLINQTLTHRTKPVALRFENDYKHRPYFITEFTSVRPLGNHAAWLIKANLGDGHPGLFIVTGNASGWHSRFLGDVEEEETRLSDSRVLFGKRIVVDTTTAAVFVIPRYQGTHYQVLGQSPDGRRIALYREESRTALEDRAGIRFDVAMLNLDTGQDEKAGIDRLPALPPGRMIYEFYGDWYRDHCTWKPLLTCR